MSLPMHRFTIPTSMQIRLSSVSPLRTHLVTLFTFALVVTEDDSAYPEVRSAVANIDDPSVPVNTLRSWLIGIIWAMLILGLNQFLFFRYPSIIVSAIRLFWSLSVFESNLRSRCSSIDFVSNRPFVGSIHAQYQGSGRIPEPRNFRCEGACTYYDDGDCRVPISIRSQLTFVCERFSPRMLMFSLSVTESVYHGSGSSCTRFSLPVRGMYSPDTSSGP